MKVKRDELLSVLEKVKPGILSKDIEDMSYFLFSGKDIVTYNDKISIQHPFKSDFQLFVKADDLYKLISRINTSEVDLSKKENMFCVTCPSLKVKLATINNEEVLSRIDNVSKSLKNAKWKSLPSNFPSNITLCSYTASKLESEKTLTCIYLSGNDCISSDNNRISHSKLDIPIDEMFIKASEIKNLLSITPTEYYIAKSWIHFKNESNCIFSIRKVMGKFPDVLSFFDFEGTEIHLPENILGCMDITTIFIDESMPAAKFRIADEICYVSVKSHSGTVNHRSKIDYKGEEINFTINPDFLKEMMKHSSSITIGKDRIKLHTDNSNFTLVTALYG